MISLKSIRKIYEKTDPPTHALDGVDLSISSGEYVAIVGPSGSGKTTLLSILGLLDVPTEGGYLFRNRNVLALSDREAAALRCSEFGFVFQLFHLMPNLSVLENVKLPLLYRAEYPKDADERARTLIGSVGLTGRLAHRAGSLSGGEQQRVAIARALVNGPSVILADEPTGNLDPEAAGEILALLETLNREGAAVVMITHDAKVAERAGRQVRIEEGRVCGETLGH